MSVKAVVKVGGSLSRGMDLPVLCEEISRLSRQHSILIVPGGGDFAEQVRAADQRFHLGDTISHWMALRAMDQYGYLLHRLIPDSIVTTEIYHALQSAESGRAAILLPSDLLMKFDPLPHSWGVTSDSIAAWIAQWIHAHRLLLLKDVDGLLETGELLATASVSQLAAHVGGVDQYLSKILSQSDLETWIINGSFPDRLLELLETGRTTGTMIGRPAITGTEKSV